MDEQTEKLLKEITGEIDLRSNNPDITMRSTKELLELKLRILSLQQLERIADALERLVALYAYETGGTGV